MADGTDQMAWSSAEKCLRESMSRYSSEMLQRCVEGRDNGLLDSMIAEVEQISSLESHKNELKERNRTLAHDNLAFEPLLNDGRSRLHILHEEAKRIGSQYDQLRTKYETLTSCRDPEMAWVLLKSASAELDRETEREIDKYFELKRTDEEITRFLDDFLERRARVHMMKVQADKLEKYAREHQDGRKRGFSLM